MASGGRQYAEGINLRRCGNGVVAVSDLEQCLAETRAGYLTFKIMSLSLADSSLALRASLPTLLWLQLWLHVPRLSRRFPIRADGQLICQLWSLHTISAPSRPGRSPASH